MRTPDPRFTQKDTGLRTNVVSVAFTADGPDHAMLEVSQRLMLRLAEVKTGTVVNVSHSLTVGPDGRFTASALVLISLEKPEKEGGFVGAV